MFIRRRFSLGVVEIELGGQKSAENFPMSLCAGNCPMEAGRLGSWETFSAPSLFVEQAVTEEA
jgi:hypothetical protein